MQKILLMTAIMGIAGMVLGGVIASQVETVSMPVGLLAGAAVGAIGGAMVGAGISG